MRLIDADAIEYEQIMDPMGNGMYSHANHVYEGDIDAMPTIDAVPVELIKEVITRLRRRRMNLDYECVDEAWDLKMQIEALEDVLSEWAERKDG